MEVKLDRSDHEFICVSLCDMGSAWLVHVPIARSRHPQDFGAFVSSVIRPIAGERTRMSMSWQGYHPSDRSAAVGDGLRDTYAIFEFRS